MSSHSWIRKLFARPPVAPITRRPRLLVESLEDRAVPATFAVTSLLDDGTAGTLRWAVDQANSTSGADLITFAPSAAGGTVTLDPARGQLELTDAAATTIDGGAAGVTIDGANATRILRVSRGAAAALDHLALTHGYAYANGVGGGISNNGTLTVTASTLSGNSANFGGGGIVNADTLTITASTLAGNSANFGGGGIVNADTLTITASTLAGNSADGVGGGIYNYGTLTVAASTLFGNSAGGDGGGISNLGTLTVAASTVAGNSAGGDGGGIYNEDTLTVTASTVAGNTAPSGNVGGIWSSGTASLENALVVGNAGSDVDGTYSATGSLVGVPAGYTLGQVVATDGAGRPLLADNGGPTQTIALVPGSPATAAGPFAAAGATVDQRGYGRPAAGNIDIGAYQTTAVPAEAASLVVTTTDDVVNGFDGLTSLREAVAYANAHAGADLITFAPSAAGGTVTLDPARGQLELTDAAATTIDGGAAGVTVDGNNATRVFRVAGGAAAALNRLTITRGRVGGVGSGGGIFNDGTLTVTASTLTGNGVGNGAGGGICNVGTATIAASTLAGNTADEGGGIGNFGTLTVTASTLAGNTAFNIGGGIRNGGTLAVTASTLAGNSAGVSGGSGGGIYNDGTATVAASTLAGNTANDGGGIKNNGTATLTSTIATDGVSGPLDPASGGNLVVGTAAAAGLEVDAGGRPLLKDNDGPTQTIALLSTSPAVGAGLAGVTGADQRGLARNANPDIGAFETQASAVTIGVTGGVYTGVAYGVSAATVTGVNGATVAAFGSPALSYTYYAGTLTAAQLATAAPLPSAPTAVGSYTAVATSNVPGYRTATSSPKCFTITRAAATVTLAVPQNAVYSGSAFAAAAAVTGVSGTPAAALDGVTPTLAYYAGGAATGAPLPAAPVNAGTYTAVASFAGSPNYSAAASATQTFTIAPRGLTVAATAANKVYDGTTAAGATLAFANAVGGQTPTATFAAAFRDKNAGAGKAVDVTGIALSPAFASNYTLAGVTAATATATVSPKGIGGAFAAADKVYDGALAATVTARTLSGVIGGDAVALTGGTATFADKSAGAGKAVALTGAALTGAGAGNYTLTGVAAATATVTKRALTVSAAGANKVYDGTTAATVALSDNRVSGDQLALGYGSAAFGTPDVGTNKPVTVAGITLTGTDAGNYTPNTTAATTAAITPAAVTVGLTTDRPVAVPGLAVTFTATVAAASGAPVTGTVTFKDGSTVLGTASVVSGVAKFTTDAFQYGNKTITATFTGGANVTTPATPPAVAVSVVRAAILADPVTGQNALFVGGTAGDDVIAVEGKSNNRYEVEIVSGCGVPSYDQEFTGAVGRVVVYAGDGNDVVAVDGNVRVPVYEFGGAGNDILIGGDNAPNVLAGGAGNDLLYAGSARDVLIGGGGGDLLFGKGGDDLMIAGTTAFDSNESALWGIQVEWTSDRSFATRVANLRGTGTGPRANGAAYLIASGANKTVFDDGAADYLVGGTGRDWYFANVTGGGVLDGIVGLSGDDVVDDLS